MDTRKLSERIASIKTAFPGNLMARHFSPDFFHGLPPSRQHRLHDVIHTGIENPDSQMGAYARRSDDYEDFAPMLDNMIRDYHGIPFDQDITQRHDWNIERGSSHLGQIDPAMETISMRVRVARNIKTFPLPGGMDKSQRLDFEETMTGVLRAFGETSGFKGRYLSLTPESANWIDDAEYTRRVQGHQMFKDMSKDRYLAAAGISSDWPCGRGMFISEDSGFIIWVGEEDQLRIMSMRKGGDLGAMFLNLKQGLDKLEELLSGFVHSPKYGYITSCPTNLGAGMRASLHIALPNLTRVGEDLDHLKNIAAGMGLSIRGAGGEHSGAGEGGLVDISPSARLGVTEKEIMERLYHGASELWRMDREAM